MVPTGCAARNSMGADVGVAIAAAPEHCGNKVRDHNFNSAKIIQLVSSAR
jgi:hypothetical protein